MNENNRKSYPYNDVKDDHKDLKHDLKELSDSDIEFNDNLLMKVLST